MMVKDAMDVVKNTGKKIGQKFLEVNHKEHRKQMKEKWDRQIEKVLNSWEMTEQFKELKVYYRVNGVKTEREDTKLVDNSSETHPFGDRMVWKSRYTILERPKEETVRKSLKVLKRKIDSEEFGLVNKTHYLSEMIDKRYFVPQIVINDDELLVLFTETAGSKNQSYTVYN